MADKYISMAAGLLTEIEATDVSAGAGDAGKIIALDSGGKLPSSMTPAGLGADTAIIVASEALAAGDLVNIHISSGAKVRKADASTVGKEAHGYVLASVLNAGNATVYFEGLDNTQTGLTAGAVQYLSPTTPGKATATAPTGTGQVVQRVGFSYSTTEFNFQCGDPVLLA